MIPTSAVIVALRPNTEWSLSGNDIANVVWHTEGVEPISREEYDAALPQLEHEHQVSEIRAARQARYVAETDPMYLKVQRKEDGLTLTDWKAAVAAIKAALPYPEAP